jgi:hypothetical protein
LRKRTFGSGQLSRREDQISKRGDQNSRRGGPKSRVLGGQAFELGHAKLLWVNNLCGSGIVVLVKKKEGSVKTLGRNGMTGTRSANHQCDRLSLNHYTTRGRLAIKGCCFCYQSVAFQVVQIKGASQLRTGDLQRTKQASNRLGHEGEVFLMILFFFPRILGARP